MGAASIRGAIRQSATDFYFNSIRFVPANVTWAATILGVLFLAILWPPAIALVVLLGIPIAGIHRMAALLARGEPASLSDFGDGMRRFGLHAAGLLAAATILGAMLLTNVVTGFGSSEPLGWFIGATALWGLVALAMFMVAAWPVLVDPKHEGVPLRRRLRLAGLVVIGRPGGLFVVTMLMAIILVGSTALLGAIVLFGVSFSSLLATHWVLPALDQLEARYEAARAH